MINDYIRDSLPTLFAAFNMLEGGVIRQCMQHHPHRELIRFLNATDAEVPTGKLVHIIMGNDAAHKLSIVMAWLERRSRWVFHFVATSAYWLDSVEGCFAKVSKRRLKHGVFHSLISLRAAINFSVGDTIANRGPVRWIQELEKIIVAGQRVNQTFDLIYYMSLAP